MSAVVPVDNRSAFLSLELKKNLELSETSLGKRCNKGGNRNDTDPEDGVEIRAALQCYRSDLILHGGSVKFSLTEGNVGTTVLMIV